MAALITNAFFRKKTNIGLSSMANTKKSFNQHTIHRKQSNTKQHKKPKKFDYTTIADILRTASWIYYKYPTGDPWLTGLPAQHSLIPQQLRKETNTQLKSYKKKQNDPNRDQGPTAIPSSEAQKQNYHTLQENIRELYVLLLLTHLHWNSKSTTNEYLSFCVFDLSSFLMSTVAGQGMRPLVLKWSWNRHMSFWIHRLGQRGTEEPV